MCGSHPFFFFLLSFVAQAPPTLAGVVNAKLGGNMMLYEWPVGNKFCTKLRL